MLNQVPSKLNTINGFLKPLEAIKKELTAYDLFAITVVIMIFGHLSLYFLPGYTWTRLPDRIFISVFLLPIGYNAGRQSGWILWSGAIILCLSDYFLMNALYINTLGTIIAIRYFIEPLMTWLIENAERFWGVMFGLAFLGPLTNIFFEYGSVAVIFSAAGWLMKNRSLADEKKISLPLFFAFTFAAHIINAMFLFPFSPIQWIILSMGLAVLFYILYDFKVLLLNALRKRPKTFFRKIRYFIGHKSLEIYVIHLVIIHAVHYLLIGPPVP